MIATHDELLKNIRETGQLGEEQEKELSEAIVALKEEFLAKTAE